MTACGLRRHTGALLLAAALGGTIIFHPHRPGNRVAQRHHAARGTLAGSWAVWFCASTILP